MSLSIEDCKKILFEYTRDNSEIRNFETQRVSSEILGYMGEHYKLVITYVDPDGIHTKKHFFVKVLPTAPAHRNYVIKGHFFKKEILVYNNLLREFQVFLDAPVAPKIYLAKTDVIVLEDLHSSGYRSYDDEDDFEFYASVMKALATLHASSVIFEEKRKFSGKEYRIDEHFPEEMREVGFVFDKNNIRTKHLQAAVKAIAECLMLLPELIDAKEIVEKLYTFGSTYAEEFIKPSHQFRNVVTHSDLWKNNIMVRRNSNNDLESILVDFQFVRYVPGAHDIIMFLCLNASRDFLEKNLNSLLDCYYVHFCKNLRAHNVAPENVLNKKEFYGSVESCKLIAVLDAAATATMAYLDENTAKKMFNIEGFFEDFCFYNRYKYIRRQFQENSSFRIPFTDILYQLVACIRDATFLNN